MRLLAAFTLLFALAAGGFLYSRTLPHMSDPGGFEAGYAQLQSDYAHGGDHMTLSRAYDHLFNSHVTVRNALKKYSLSLMVLAASGMLLFCRGAKRLTSPHNKWLLVPIAALATAITMWGNLADLNEAYGRGEVPEWSNLERGAIGVMFVYPVVCSLVVLVQMALIFGEAFNRPATIFPVPVRNAHPIPAVMLILTLGLTAWSALDGGWYFSLMATPFWLYFHASVLAIRARGRFGVQSR